MADTGVTSVHSPGPYTTPWLSAGAVRKSCVENGCWVPAAYPQACVTHLDHAGHLQLCAEQQPDSALHFSLPSLPHSSLSIWPWVLTTGTSAAVELGLSCSRTDLAIWPQPPGTTWPEHVERTLRAVGAQAGHGQALPVPSQEMGCCCCFCLRTHVHVWV